MTEKDFIHALTDCYPDVTFLYKGKNCGIFPEVHDSIPIFHTWFGDSEKDFDSVENLLSANFFDGASLRSILKNLDIDFY